MSDPEHEPETGKAAAGWRAAAVLSGAGLGVAAAIAAGALGGNWLDHRLGTAPWLLVVGFFVGTIAGFAQWLRLVAVAGRK